MFLVVLLLLLPLARGGANSVRAKYEERYLDPCPFRGWFFFRFFLFFLRHARRCAKDANGNAGPRDVPPVVTLLGMIAATLPTERGGATVVYSVKVIRMEGSLAQCDYREAGQTGIVMMHSEFRTAEDGAVVCTQRADLKVGDKFVARGRCEGGLFFEAPCKGISVVPVFARLAKDFMLRENLNSDALQEQKTAREFIVVKPLLTEKQIVMRWFQELPVLVLSDLRSGDVLLEKNFEETSPVVTGQKLMETRFVYGTKFTNHAMFVLEGGAEPIIAHSTSHGPDGRSGLVRETLSSIREREPNRGANFRFAVYRPVDTRAVSSAVATMTHLLSRDIGYSMAHIAGSGALSRGFGGANFGPRSRGRASSMFRQATGQEQVPLLTRRNMMCSEAVAFAYQGTQDPFVKLDAKHASPMQLEEYFRLSLEWTVAGRIGNAN